MISRMLAGAFAVTNIAGYPPRDSELVKLWGLAAKAASGAEVNTKSVLGLSAVFRAVNIIGNDVRKCRPFIYERLGGGRPDPQGQDKRRAMDHPAWRVVTRRANEWMSAGEFRKTLTLAAILRGNGIGHVERDAAGRVLEMFPLLPDRTGMAIFGARLSDETPYPVDAQALYWTKVGGQVRTILPENIIHIRGLSHNGVWGLDVIEVMRETFGLAIAARDCGARFYGQGMLGSGLLYMPTGMAKGPKAEEAIANFIKSVKDQAQGLSRAHKLLVLEEGAKYEKLSVDPEQAQALETREFEVREIANVIGCQPHKLGDTKRTSYASLEQSNQEHLDDDIDPHLTNWEEALEDVALSEEQKESGSHFVECNRKALMRTNLAARGSYYTQARNGGWMSANDIRRAEGEPPIGEQGDTYLVPANMTPADQAGAAFTDSPPAGDDEKQARLAAGYRELALHELERLAHRACERAMSKAATGAGYLEFLGELPSWCEEPAALRADLAWMGGRLVAELGRFTEPPYTASQLRENVIGAAPRIEEQLVCEAEDRLTTTIARRGHSPGSKAA